MFPPAVAVSALVATTISAAGLLVFGRIGVAASSARLGAIGLMVATAVTVAGLMVGRSRWAQRQAWLLATLALLSAAVSRPVDVWWVGTILMAVGTGSALGLRPVEAWLAAVERRAGVPREAVLLLLILLNAPLLAALIHPQGVGVASIAAAALAWILMWAYSQAWVAALWLLRFGLPVLGVGWAWGSSWWGWAAVAVVAISATRLAWKEGSLLAAQPLEPRRVVARPILAELAPEDVRTVAGIDERGAPL